jgi:4-diphosphocytidyl-2-C-methyl-D-erythritol kinase
MNRKTAIRSISLPAPAKVNLNLAVIGPRPDGFHELVTLMSKINLCDLVILEKTENKGETLCICEDSPDLDGEKNLAWQAVALWRKETEDETGFRISIKKRIPSMAGLGGGSSNAVAVLKALNLWSITPLTFEKLKEISSQLGSDCPSFLVDGACIATGRGEKVRPLNKEANDHLVGKRLFLFKPPIGFSTGAIYDELSEKKDAYSSKESAEMKIQALEEKQISIFDFMSNDLENVVLDKYCFVKPLFDLLFDHFGICPMLSGSGSCCFAFLPEECPLDKVIDCIKEAWGDDTFLFQGRLRS